MHADELEPAGEGAAEKPCQLGHREVEEGSGSAGFKIGYPSNAMPVRLAVETRDWAAAARLAPVPGSAPQVAAITWWARALGKSRAATPGAADADIAELQACREALRVANDGYWMAQVDALLKSAQGWRLAAAGDAEAAVASMTAAADAEDALEKLPLTPGPVVPITPSASSNVMAPLCRMLKPLTVPLPAFVA